MTRRCLECGEQFSPYRTQHMKLTCSPKCTAKREQRRQRLKQYGLSVQAYDELWELQDGCCAICGLRQDQSGRTLAVDHDHSCCPGKKACGKCVRGLLCSPCNTGLGAFGDDPRMMRKAIAYLEIRGLREKNLEHLLEAAWGTAWVGSVRPVT